MRWRGLRRAFAFVIGTSIDWSAKHTPSPTGRSESQEPKEFQFQNSASAMAICYKLTRLAAGAARSLSSTARLRQAAHLIMFLERMA